MIKVSELADAIHEASAEHSDGYRTLSEVDARGIAAILLDGVEDKSVGFLSDDRGPRVVILDIETGDWLEGSSPIFETEGVRLAASLLPGMTEEALSKAYDDFMKED